MIAKPIKIIAVCAVAVAVAGCQQMPLTKKDRTTSQYTQQSASSVDFMLAYQRAVQNSRPLRLGNQVVYLQPQPVLTRMDLSQVTPMKTKNGQAFVRFQFTGAGATKLATITQRNRGDWILLAVNNQLVNVARIQSPSKDGILNLNMNSEQEAIRVAESITAKPGR